MAYSFIWDMDGTLVDSYPVIVPAAQQACHEYGLNFSAEYIHKAVIRTSVGTFLEEECKNCGLDSAPVKARFNQLNDSHIDRIRAISHAEDTLKILTASGHECFVYTHRGASCHAILEQTNLLPYFTAVITALDGFPRKPDPAAILYLIEKYSLLPDHCFYVGDRSLDIEAANNAGIQSILFLDSKSPINATGHETHVVSDLLEICLRLSS
ncbi:MAG: HAD-IA family hydrolase [Oscillospiraceae bacterium]|nr:HAD-IA family hydrolase [Clostridia bacterium]MBP3209380.1 HAD-IA family hydrolase [Oscillospiraceae bacterium]